MGWTTSASTRAQLVPPATKDAYEDEAYRMLELKAAQGKRKARDLFDE